MKLITTKHISTLITRTFLRYHEELALDNNQKNDILRALSDVASNQVGLLYDNAKKVYFITLLDYYLDICSNYQYSSEINPSSELETICKDVLMLMPKKYMTEQQRLKLFSHPGWDNLPVLTGFNGNISVLPSAYKQKCINDESFMAVITSNSVAHLKSIKLQSSIVVKNKKIINNDNAYYLFSNAKNHTRIELFKDYLHNIFMAAIKSKDNVVADCIIDYWIEKNSFLFKKSPNKMPHLLVEIPNGQILLSDIASLITHEKLQEAFQKFVKISTLIDGECRLSDLDDAAIVHESPLLL